MALIVGPSAGRWSFERGGVGDCKGLIRSSRFGDKWGGERGRLLEWLVDYSEDFLSSSRRESNLRAMGGELMGWLLLLRF